MRSFSSCVLGDMECDRTSLGGNGVWTGLQSLMPFFFFLESVYCPVRQSLIIDITLYVHYS